MASIRAPSLLALPQSDKLHGTSGKMRKLQLRNKHVVMAALAAQTPMAAAAVESGNGAVAIGKTLEKRSNRQQQVFKGWLDESTMEEDHKLVAKLRQLQVTARDRKEMHEIIGQQRDNWNKLFQGTLRLATVSAALLAALSGAATTSTSTTSSPSLCAGVLDVVSALIMLAVNKFQPSQLAEEQRNVARLFGVLYQEIEAVLAVDPRLREDAPSFFLDKISKLHALDAAYPLPLTPGGLEKFPCVVAPSWIGTLFDKSSPIIPVVPAAAAAQNGWTKQIEEDLLRMSEALNRKDIPNYIALAKTILKANSRLAIAAPALAMIAGIANLAQVLPLAAAMCSIGAFFAGSLSHDMQMGMIFEMYRNCAGHYANADAAIQRTLRLPVEQREDGDLFHQKIAHLLGRRDEFPAVPEGAETAGTLF